MTNKTNYYKKNRGIILNRAKEYYEINKERLREQEISEKENDIKREYGKNRYKNMSEENKQRLKEYQKKFS